MAHVFAHSIFGSVFCSIDLQMTRVQTLGDSKERQTRKMKKWSRMDLKNVWENWCVTNVDLEIEIEVGWKVGWGKCSMGGKILRVRSKKCEVDEVWETSKGMHERIKTNDEHLVLIYVLRDCCARVFDL